MLKKGICLSYLPLPFLSILEGIYEVSYTLILFLFVVGFLCQVKCGTVKTALLAGGLSSFLSLGLLHLFFGSVPPLGDEILAYLKPELTVDLLSARYYSYGIKICSYFSLGFYSFLAVCRYLEKKWCL